MRASKKPSIYSSWDYLVRTVPWPACLPACSPTIHSSTSSCRRDGNTSSITDSQLTIINLPTHRMRDIPSHVYGQQTLVLQTSYSGIQHACMLRPRHYWDYCFSFPSLFPFCISSESAQSSLLQHRPFSSMTRLLFWALDICGPPRES